MFKSFHPVLYMQHFDYVPLYSLLFISVTGPSSAACTQQCISMKDCKAAIFDSRKAMCELHKKAMTNEVKSSSVTDLMYLVTVSARNMVSISNVDVLQL